jgi:hypothetical protein
LNFCWSSPSSCNNGTAFTLDEPLAAAPEAEVEAGVHLVVGEPRVEHLVRAAPDLAKQKEVRSQLGAAARAVRLPEVVLDVLDGVEAKAVEADAPRETEMGVKQILPYLGQFGPEIR